MRKINLIGQAADQSEGSSEWDEDNMVLRLDGEGAPPFVLKGRINKQPPFSTMIDSGLPITTLTREVVRRLLKTGMIPGRIQHKMSPAKLNRLAS